MLINEIIIVFFFLNALIHHKLKTCTKFLFLYSLEFSFRKLYPFLIFYFYKICVGSTFLLVIADTLMPTET